MSSTYWCYDFVNLKFQWSMGCQMLNRGSTKDHKINWNRDAYFSQVLVEIHSMPSGARQGGKAVCWEREWQDQGHIPLLESMGGMLWGSWARVGLVNSNQKCRVLVSSMKFLSKAYTKGILWEARKLLITMAFGEILSGTCKCLWPWELLTKAYIYMEKASVSLKFPKSAWPNKKDAWTMVPWSSLAKPSTIGKTGKAIFLKNINCGRVNTK